MGEKKNTRRNKYTNNQAFALVVYLNRPEQLVRLVAGLVAYKKRDRITTTTKCSPNKQKKTAKINTNCNFPKVKK